jgi:hypothetical protein
MVVALCNALGALVGFTVFVLLVEARGLNPTPQTLDPEP